MKKLFLLFISFALSSFSQSIYPITANRIIRGNGVPSAGTCGNAAAVGKVYIRQDAAATFHTFYVCANTASMTYAWELGGGGGGTGCTTSGTGVQTGDGAGGCTNNSGVTISSNTLAATGGFTSGSSPPSVTPGTGGVPFACGEGTVPSVGAAVGVDVVYCDSTAHRPLLSVNNGSFLPLVQGPASSTTSDCAAFADTSGAVLKDVACGSGGGAYAASLGPTANIAMNGTDVTIFSVASVPALAANKCYEIEAAVNGVSAAAQMTLYVDTTLVFALGPLGGSGYIEHVRYMYCNNPSVQNAQTLLAATKDYGANTGTVGWTLDPLGVTDLITPTANIDWSTSHTVKITSNAASGNIAGVAFRIGQ